MSSHGWKVIAILALIAVLAGSAACKPRQTADQEPQTPQAAAEDTPGILAKLAGVDLAEQQESLVLEYLRLGGLAEVKKRWGEPTEQYETYVEADSSGYVQLSEDQSYLFQFGFDKAGKAVVMMHLVETTTDKPATDADRAFVAAIKDGKTTMEEANAYIGQVKTGDVYKASINDKDTKVPALVWRFEDDSGFLIMDLTGLTQDQMENFGMIDQGPWEAAYWDASRIKAYAPANSN